MGKRIVEEYDWGLYVWVTNDGKMVADEDHNIMNIQAKRGDMEAVRKLKDAARSYGYEDGKALFLGGRRRITDEQLAEQQFRLKMGLIPDPLDFKAAEDELRYEHKYHTRA